MNKLEQNKPSVQRSVRDQEVICDMNRTDPLEFLTQDELTHFFHCKKTEISCMEEPHTFLHQLRDHNLVPEPLYQKVIKMKCKNRRQEGVYQILDWLEEERPECVKLFWTIMLKKYPVLCLLLKPPGRGGAPTARRNRLSLPKRKKKMFY